MELVRPLADQIDEPMQTCFLLIFILVLVSFLSSAWVKISLVYKTIFAWWYRTMELSFPLILTLLLRGYLQKILAEHNLVVQVIELLVEKFITKLVCA